MYFQFSCRGMQTRNAEESKASQSRLRATRAVTAAFSKRGEKQEEEGKKTRAKPSKVSSKITTREIKYASPFHLDVFGTLSVTNQNREPSRVWLFLVMCVFVCRYVCVCVEGVCGGGGVEERKSRVPPQAQAHKIVRNGIQKQ